MNALQPVTRFSLKDAKALIKDLGRPNPTIYWTDFLLTMVTAHILLAAEIRAYDWLKLDGAAFWCVRGAMFGAAALLYMRGVMFIHELVHLRPDSFRGFRVAWNLLCGIPCLVPSFMYYPHVDHHRRKSYGTDHDGEYIELSHKHPMYIVLFILAAFIVPPLAFFRFLILTPIAWCWPALREKVELHASTLVVDIFYLRGDFGPTARRQMLLQEAACFGWCLFLVARGPISEGTLLGEFWLHAYALSVTLILINNVRTLGAHRWISEGQELTFEEQMLDSLNYPHRPWITELWGPIGVRYHALHHLFPSVPYHNLGKAHRRLRAGLPPDSIYHACARVSLFGAIVELWQRAARASSASKQLKGTLPNQRAA
ncbi:MAG: fatty acid desaturase [Pirellulaceae bacterium]|nr:fatty acid desaturase [Pirellulaceae bacterium]